ncbi:hypothetical protein RI065_00770 [Mycoplasmatota bacterium zrk1]
MSLPHEWGTLPQQGKRNDLADIMLLLQEGATPYEVKREYPTQYLRYQDKIHKVHQEELGEKYKKVFRHIDAFYIGDVSRAGKTRYVMDKYGYENVYRISNYKNPFDGYEGQDVIIFEEFRDSLPIADMLIYLEGYPLKLPARYNDKQACFTKVFVISNWDWKKQYREEFYNSRETYIAWESRFTRIGTLQDIKYHIEQLELPPKETKIYKNAVELFGEDLVTIKDDKVDDLLNEI